jgi:hypothetical protein
LVGGLIGLVNGGHDLGQWLFARPQVTAAATTPLRLTHDPRARKLTFSFGVLLHNEGVKAERIRDARAHVLVTGPADRRFSFNVTQFRTRDAEGAGMRKAKFRWAFQSVRKVIAALPATSPP